MREILKMLSLRSWLNKENLVLVEMTRASAEQTGFVGQG